MSTDEITLLELEARNQALNELLERTIQGLPTDPAELRKTLKLHYLRQFLNSNNVPDYEHPMYIRQLKLQNHADTLDLHSDIDEWVSNQRYCARNIVAVVTRGISWGKGPYENGNAYIGDEPEDLEVFDRSIKAVLELHPIRIGGLHTGFGGEGREWVNPNIKASFTAIEKYGRAIDKLMHFWHDRHLAWSNLNGPGMAHTPPQSSVTIDMVFFEPDPTHTKVVMAWKGSNLHPIYYSGIRSKRDIQSQPIGQTEQLVFELGGDYTTGEEVMAEAQTVLNGLALLGQNPYTSKEFVSKIDDHVVDMLIDRL